MLTDSDVVYYALVHVCVSVRGFKPQYGSGQTKQNSYLKPKHTRQDMKVQKCVFGLNVCVCACSCSWSHKLGEVPNIETICKDPDCKHAKFT